MSGEIEAIFRYPVKGLTGQALTEVWLEPGSALPFDRAFAIETGSGRFNPSDPKALPRENFLNLLRDERLAVVEARFEENDSTLSLFRAGKRVAHGNLTTTAGRAIIEQFFAAYMGDSARGVPKIRFARAHSFGDAGHDCVHVINLATLSDVERAVGRPLSALRFRPNIIVRGFEPWEEFSWIDREIVVGDAHLKVFGRTERCAVINVDPTTAHRDLDIPATLRRHWHHADFGVYARVIGNEAHVRAGDPVTVI